MPKGSRLFVSATAHIREGVPIRSAPDCGTHSGRFVLIEAVQRQVAERLRSRVLERALAQYVAVLAGQADVRGVDLGATPTLLVQ